MMFGEGNKDGVLPIIAISFCWATPAHPDPDGEQLGVVVKVLEGEMEKYSTGSFMDMGIFWDVCHTHTFHQTHAPFDPYPALIMIFPAPCSTHVSPCLKKLFHFTVGYGSLYQKDPALWHPCCGGPTFVVPELRSAAEKEAAEAYEASRTAEEKVGFGKALHETMDL
eukprot:289210-Prymnesium_polylepis.1